MTKDEYMVDIETLGTAQDAAIAAIGCCKFDRDTGEILDTFYVEINWADQDRICCPDTIDFWSKQSTQARKCLKGETPLDQALLDFSLWITKTSLNLKNIKMWGNSNKFDLGMLENAHLQYGIPYAWKESWYGDSCLRTLKVEMEGVFGRFRVKRGGTYHHALDDAKHQVKVLCKILDKLKEVGGKRKTS